MPRTAKPWRNPAKGDAWYVWVNRKRVRLGPATMTFKEAQKALARVSLHDDAPVAVSHVALRTFRDIARAFLAHVDRTLAPLTCESYRRHLTSACAAFGGMPVTSVRAGVVEKWLSLHGWAQATQRSAITAVKRVTSWSKREGLIDVDPIAGMRRPAATRNERTLSTQDRSAIAELVPESGPLRDVIDFLRETGSRPSELAKVEARHVDFERGIIRLTGKTTRATGRQRVIVLTPVASEICRRLASRHPSGPLFRNARGGPWTRHALGHRFRRMRAKNGMLEGVTAKTYRHSFCTDALEGGADLAAVSVLMGHSSPAMVMQVYSKLNERVGYLRGQAAKANPSEGPRD